MNPPTAQQPQANGISPELQQAIMARQQGQAPTPLLNQTNAAAPPTVSSGANIESRGEKQ